MRDLKSPQQIAGLLDRFRWRQLRMRHGRLGSAIRLLRDMLVDSFHGLQARRALDTNIRQEPCDILLLQSTPRVIDLQRKRLFKAALQDKGYRLLETALDDPDRLAAAKCYMAPTQAAPLRYYHYLAHAEWLMAKYSPRLLLNDRNGSLFAPFLRWVLNRAGRPLIQLAHATTVERSRRLDMNDYDYYFLFGRSSLEALQRRKLRFGSSTAVLTGSHMIDGAYDLPPADPLQRTLLILGVGPDKEKLAGYQKTYLLLREWAIAHPEYRLLVKAHPRSDVPFWRESATLVPNLAILPRECTLAEALSRASVAINIMSNAAIEAGLAGRPVVFVNASDDRDIFAQEHFLGGRQTTLAAMQTAIERIEADYPAAAHCAREFAEYHLAHGSQGLRKTIDTLEEILAMRPLTCEHATLPAEG